VSDVQPAADSELRVSNDDVLAASDVLLYERDVLNGAWLRLTMLPLRSNAQPPGTRDNVEHAACKCCNTHHHELTTSNGWMAEGFISTRHKNTQGN